MSRSTAWAGALAVVIALAAPRAAHAFVWPNVPQRIARALASSDTGDRRNAVHQIHDLPPELALPLVKTALGDSDTDVRVEAAALAAQLKLAGSGDTVIPWLSETDSRIRLAACQVIFAAPTPAAIQALGRVLADQNAQVRLAAAHAMGASQTPDAVSPLLGHLDDSSPEVRAEVAGALGKLSDVHAVLPLVGKVRDTSADVRRRVVRSLGELGDGRAVSALVLALSDANVDVRLEAVRALGLLGSDEATSALTPIADGTAIDSSDGAILPQTEGALALRQAALEALGRIATDRAIAVLVGALSQDRPDALRMPAHDALVRVGERAVKPLIAHLAASPPAAEAGETALALGAIGDRAAAQPIVRGLERGVVPATAGLPALALLHASDALPTVLELLADPDPKVRRAAITAARALLDPKHPDGRAVEPIQAALEAARSNDERVALIELLGRTGAPRVQTVLLSMAGAKSTPVRRATFAALGMLSASADDVDGALLKALDDDDALARSSAAQALAKVGSSKVALPLLQRLVDSAEQDRGALGLAISGVLSRTTSDEVVARAAAAEKSAPDSSRDALIEGLGRMSTAAALTALAEIARGGAEDRRKVAESVGAKPAAESLLLTLSHDVDPSVRAAAAWSLGRSGGASAVSPLVLMLADPDVAVASNAAGALGRVAPRLGDASAVQKALQDPLCHALADARSYVRANALGALTLARVSCDAKLVLGLLQTDVSEVVRARAAWALAVAPSPAIKKALARCAADDTNATVAETCETPVPPTPLRGEYDMTIFVVPDGRDVPVSGAPFTLVLPDGLLRTGSADRRGAFFESSIPDGTVELGVPAALAP